MFSKNKDKQEKKLTKEEKREKRKLLKKLKKYEGKDPLAEVFGIYRELGESNLNILKSYWDNMENTGPEEDFEFMKGIKVSFTKDSQTIKVYLGGGKGKIISPDEIDTKFECTMLHDLLIDSQEEFTEATINIIAFQVHMYVATLCMDQLNKQLEDEEFKKAVKEEYENQQKDVDKQRNEVIQKRQELIKKRKEFLNNYQELKLNFFDEEYKFKMLGKDILLINKTKLLLTQSLIFLILINLFGKNNLEILILFIILTLLVHSFRLILRIFNILSSYL